MSQKQVKRTRAEADLLVEGFERSGLSRRAFAAQAGVSVNTLDFYRKQRGRVGTRQAPWKPGTKAEAAPADRQAEPGRPEAAAESGQAGVGAGAQKPERRAGGQAEKPKRPAAPRWIEVRAAAPPAAMPVAAPAGAALRVVCGNGLRVEVEPGFDAATLGRLLDLLLHSLEGR